MSSTPAHTGGKYFTAADARPQGDGSQLYAPGDDPWNEPLLFDPNTGKPIPGQGGANLGPRHAPLNVFPNADGTAWRFENILPWAPGDDPASGSGGYVPQASAADAAAAQAETKAQAAAMAHTLIDVLAAK